MESATNVSQPINPVLQTATQKVQEAFSPLFELMQYNDFRHAVEFINAYPIPEVEFTDDGYGVIIKHLPSNHTRKRMENSPIIDVCHQLKHLYGDGDRIGRTGIKQKKKNGHRLENKNLRMCISYTYIVRVVPGDGNEVVIRFYADQAKSNRARVRESFKREDVSDADLKELKESGRLACHNRTKVMAWRFLSDEEQQDLLKVIITTCAEEVKQYLHDAYSSAYLRKAVPEYLVMTPPPTVIP